MVSLFVSGVTLGFDHEHKSWDTMLKKYQNSVGFVNYAAWKKSPKELNTYLASLSSVKKADYDKWSVGERKAFLINAYNAFTVKLILNHYPVKSIRKIGSFFSNPWKMEFFSILDGELQSLDPIEHQWLRKIPEFKDPRIHAAVNCASVSCPKLANDAYVAKKLDAQLDAATRYWLSDDTRNRYDMKKHDIYISKIFDWYDEDFGGNDKGVIEFIKKYAPKEVSEYLTKQKVGIEYLKYDWNLNEFKGPSKIN